MKGFKKALPELLIVFFMAALFIPACILAARSAAADSTGVTDSSQEKAPASTAQYRGTSQGYDVTITDRGRHLDPEFKRLVEMDRCVYRLWRGEVCESIVGVGNPYEGFWEWTEVRQCITYRGDTGCRAFRPVKEKCYIVGIKPPRPKKRCTAEEEVDLLDLTLRLENASLDILEKKETRL